MNLKIINKFKNYMIIKNKNNIDKVYFINNIVDDDNFMNKIIKNNICIKKYNENKKLIYNKKLNLENKEHKIIINNFIKSFENRIASYKIDIDNINIYKDNDNIMHAYSDIIITSESYCIIGDDGNAYSSNEYDMIINDNGIYIYDIYINDNDDYYNIYININIDFINTDYFIKNKDYLQEDDYKDWICDNIQKFLNSIFIKLKN